MNPFTSFLRVNLPMGALALLLVGSAAYADMTPAGGHCVETQNSSRADFQRQHQDHLAQLLKLTPQQQSAWQAFAKADQANLSSMSPPPENFNVVELAQWRAQRAELRAAQLADASKATRQLWSVLTEEQRMTFDHVMQREMMFGHPQPGTMPPIPPMPPMPPQ